MPQVNIPRKIAELGPWFHNLHLPSGEQTAPEHFLADIPREKWQQISPLLPADMSHWNVLDIGCNAGYYSFELAKRGARVTAIDVNDHYLAQAQWAASVLDLEDNIEFRKASVYQLARERVQYDLVWFMGVFHHLRYPLLALDIVRQCSKGQMIFQTMTLPGENVFSVAENYDLEQHEVMNNPGWPKMAFIENRIENDPNTWWAPNHVGIEAMLRAAGFVDIDRIAHEIYSCRASSASVFGSDELLDIPFVQQSGNQSM